jgi:hypothetical protein
VTAVAPFSQSRYSPGKVTRVAQDFSPRVRRVDGNGSAAAISSDFLLDQVMPGRTYAPAVTAAPHHAARLDVPAPRFEPLWEEAAVAAAARTTRQVVAPAVHVDRPTAHAVESLFGAHVQVDRPRAQNLRTLGVLAEEPELIRHVDRHLQIAATSGVPLFDRRHAW